jgi:accessory gene regulator protein AgrB
MAQNMTGVGNVILVIVAILAAIVLVAALVFVLWVLPIMWGVKQARKKNYSPAWMWFGVHPLLG